MFTAPSRAAEVELRVEHGKTTRILGHAMMIKADTSRMQQVLVNLVSNAVRYGAQGTIRKVSVNVDVAAPQADGSKPRPPTLSPPEEAAVRELTDGERAYLFVSVSDTGPGMTPDQQSRLFSKFSQTGSPSTQTGLGLYIAKKLCDLQGGGIEVTSTAGGGSTFIACFEIRAVVPPVVDVIERSASDPTPADRARTNKSLRILAVDDNIINRKILRRQLLQEGHDCSLASDGQDAWVSSMFDATLNFQLSHVTSATQDTIHANEKTGQRFDCIILDCNMPVLSGIECAQRLRAEEKQRGPDFEPYWILGCTGQARPEQVRSLRGASRSIERVLIRDAWSQIQAALDAGFNQVITKPCGWPIEALA